MPLPIWNRLRHNFVEPTTGLHWWKQNAHLHYARRYHNGVLAETKSDLFRDGPYEPRSLIWDDAHERRPKVDGKRGSGRYPMGDCLQISIDYSKLGPVIDYVADNGDEWRFDNADRPYQYMFSTVTSHLQGNPQTDSGYDHLSRIPGIPDALRSTLSEQAFNYFSDTFPTTLSAAEFVQGLIEMKALLPSVQDSIAKSFTGGYLNKSFGWDNLLRDLDTLGTLLTTISDRMEYLRRTYGIPTRLGFSRENVWTPSAYPTFIHWFGPFGTRLTLKSYRADYRATAWIYQVLDHVDGLMGFIRVTAGALGLNNPIKAFWNVIPLSFVVDWFFNVSQHLDNLTRLDPPVGWDVNDVTHSVTYSLTWEVAQWSFHCQNKVFPSVLLPQRVYDRRVGLFFPWELLNPEDLSTNQLTLLLAMLHQLG